MEATSFSVCAHATLECVSHGDGLRGRPGERTEESTSGCPGGLSTNLGISVGSAHFHPMVRRSEWKQPSSQIVGMYR